VVTGRAMYQQERACARKDFQDRHVTDAKRTCMVPLAINIVLLMRHATGMEHASLRRGCANAIQLSKEFRATNARRTTMGSCAKRFARTTVHATCMGYAMPLGFAIAKTGFPVHLRDNVSTSCAHMIAQAMDRVTMPLVRVLVRVHGREQIAILQRVALM